MNIWLDLANSPQVLFFRPILTELVRRGHQISITTRAYAQTVQLADKFGLDHTVVGRHGGRQMSGLVVQNFLRALELSRWAERCRFDLAISHNSYSLSVAAALLHVPAVTLMDYEYQPLNHLCFRLSRRVILPEPFPIEMVRKYGASKKAYFYPGIKEQVYLADFIPDEHFYQSAELPADCSLVVVRPPAPWTAYHRFENDIFDQLLAHLVALPNSFVLFLPRLPSQAESLMRLRNLQIAQKVYDGPNLLYYADLVVSGGGTMNREAAVLGTPTYTVFKGKLGSVDRYLIELGRMHQIIESKDFYKIRLQKKNNNNHPLSQPGLIEQVVNLILG